MAGAGESDGEPVQAPQNSGKKRRLESALQVGPRKKPSQQDPLVHYGRHFGRTIHAMCNMRTLLSNAVQRAEDGEYDDEPALEDLPPNQRRERRVYRDLLRTVPRLEERIMTATVEELRMISEALEKGANSARSDDTKSLKGAVLDWITPRGIPLVPPIARNSKVDRGFHHDSTGSLLCPAGLSWTDPVIKTTLRDPEHVVPGDNWPILVYKEYRYDPSNPWVGLFRSKLLISAYKHIFTSPSSVEKEPKATRSGNARIHGMTSVTAPSLAYIATQVRFALSSSSVFSRTDMTTDSERFYNSIVDFLEDPQENAEVNELLMFWNRQIFPEQCAAKRPITKNSALAKLKERRAALGNLTNL